MSSKSLSKCFEGKMYLQTHNNSRVIWPKSLINIQKFVNNNNTEEASDIYLVMPSEYEEEGNTEGATPLILSTEGVLQINGNEKNCYIQAEDNKSIVNNQEVSNDEELTSLTWLQNVDLLQSMKFLSNAPGILREPVIGSGETLNNRMKLESQSISYHDSGNESSWDESNQSNPETLPNGTCWNNRPIPAQSRANAKSLSRLTKPPHSFSTMIFLAIESSSTKALPVRDIYSWIIKHFPYYRYAPLGWKNSVRHNLSLNRCFCKHENGPSAGKGSLWTVDPAHRPQLIQSLGKAPYLKADLIQQIVRDRPTDFKNMDSTLLVSISESPTITSTNRSNIPDPKLFPYLSRHLAIKSNSIDNSDVDAATAMLALGQSHEHTLNSDATQNQQWALLPKKDYSLRKNRVTTGPMISVEGTEEESKAREDIIAASNSPLTIDDHTYSFSPRQGRPRSQSSNVHLLGKKLFSVRPVMLIIPQRPLANLKSVRMKEFRRNTVEQRK